MPRHALLSISLTLGSLLSAFAIGQSVPPIYDSTPDAPASTRLLAEFDKGTFLENVAVDSAGNLFVNSYLDGKVWRIDAGGRRLPWASIDGTIAGIALNPDGSAVLSGWIQGKEPAVFIVDRQGKSEVLVRLVGGMFPNGVVRLAKDQYLVADSYRGVVWRVDSARRSATLWLEHASLTRANDKDPTPAINGIKMFGGALWASNTARQLLVRIPVVDGVAGQPETIRTDIGIDDFAFDARGNLYGATHVYNSLIRITPGGAVSRLAGLEQGMAGSTAVAAMNAADGSVSLVVVTNGGMSLPPAGGMQAAKVVRVDVPAPP